MRTTWASVTIEGEQSPAAPSRRDAPSPPILSWRAPRAPAAGAAPVLNIELPPVVNRSSTVHVQISAKAMKSMS